MTRMAKNALKSCVRQTASANPAPIKVLQKSTGIRPQELSRGMNSTPDTPHISAAMLLGELASRIEMSHSVDIRPEAGMPPAAPKSPQKAPNETMSRMLCFLSEGQFSGSSGFSDG